MSLHKITNVSKYLTCVTTLDQHDTRRSFHDSSFFVFLMRCVLFFFEKTSYIKYFFLKLVPKHNQNCAAPLINSKSQFPPPKKCHSLTRWFPSSFEFVVVATRNQETKKVWPLLPYFLLLFCILSFQLLVVGWRVKFITEREIQRERKNQPCLQTHQDQQDATERSYCFLSHSLSHIRPLCHFSFPSFFRG